MEKKTNHNNNEPKLKRKSAKESAKTYEFLEQYYDLLTFQMKPVSRGFIERLAQDLVKWSQKEDSLVLGDFCSERYIERKLFWNWCQKYPEMSKAYEYAKSNVSSRREKGALTRKFDAGFVKESMPIYDQDWKDLLEWKAKIKADNLESSQAKIVVLSDLEYKNLETKE
jgi:hypothetical protein